MANDNWQTPDAILDLVHELMHTIDLDPASSEEANRRVRALKYYSEGENGLILPWSGSVFLNPPYSNPLCGKFVDKAIREIESGKVSELVGLFNAATDTKWFHRLARISQLALITEGRIGFIDPETKKPANNNRSGQVIFYAGTYAEENQARFKRIFRRLGSFIKYEGLKCTNV